MRIVAGYRVAAILVFGIGACLAAAVVHQAAMAALNKADPGVVWNKKGAITADVTCDGKPDLVIVGQKGGTGVVAVVPDVDSPGKPIIGEYPTGRPDLQDGFCAAPLKVFLERRDCQWENGSIPDCKVVKGCTAFRVEGGECDAFHFYWDNKAKELTYNRL